MTNKLFTVIDAAGMHARPASLLTQRCSHHSGKITIKSGDKQGNMKSIMSVMAMGIKMGQDFEVIIEGDGSVELMEEISKLLKEHNIIA